MTRASKLWLVALVIVAVGSIVTITILLERTSQYERVATRLDFSDPRVRMALDRWMESDPGLIGTSDREFVEAQSIPFLTQDPERYCVHFLAKQSGVGDYLISCFDRRTGNPIVLSQTTGF